MRNSLPLLLCSTLALPLVGIASAAPTHDERERAAAAALSDLVNEDRTIAPRYTDPVTVR